MKKRCESRVNMLKLSIHQPNYLPWIGYFDKLDQSDCSVFLDQAKLAHRSVTNRNYILSPKGKLLLTVPLKKGEEIINKVRIANCTNWKSKHWAAMEANYKKAPFWSLYMAQFKEIYDQEWDYLYELNIRLIELICRILTIDVKFYRESDFGEDFGKGSERIANIAKKLSAETYISGKGAQAYNNPEDFSSKGIELVYQNFQHPIYQQRWGGNFTKNLSIIDLIFNKGPESIQIIRSTRNDLFKL